MKKVLVVDDDIVMLDLMKIILEVENFKVKTISDPKVIYKTYSSFEPDLVILDVHLPNANGMDLSKELKTLKAESNTPILLYSADRNVGFNYLHSGAEAFLAKPFSVSELIGKIRSILFDQHITGFPFKFNDN